MLIDDAGFGNPSTFGGPIETPNYTRMAERGLRYNRFHVTALCSPTRAALLTGRNSHAVGFGSVGEFSGGFPGYTAFVPARLRAVPEDPAGQRLQHRRVRQVAPDARRPAGPGRARSTAGRTAGASTTSTGSSAAARASGTRCLAENQKIIGTPERVLRRGRALLLARRHGRQDDRVAARRPRPGRRRSRSSPTSPRAAATRRTTSPKEWADKYKGKFDQGWDRLREETFARQKELGVIPPDAELTPRDEAFPAWDDVPDKLKALLRPPDGGLRRATPRTPTTTSAA